MISPHRGVNAGSNGGWDQKWLLSDHEEDNPKWEDNPKMEP